MPKPREETAPETSRRVAHYIRDGRIYRATRYVERGIVVYESRAAGEAYARIGEDPWPIPPQAEDGDPRAEHMLSFFSEALA